MAAYYNEIDEYNCRWLRNLIDAGAIAPGEVDNRDIREVSPGDLEGFTQVHLFAGVGVWSYAARLAGWADDRPLWTASCPCPPFSTAGHKRTCPRCESTNLVWCPRQTGHAICAACGEDWEADTRHLWPEAWRLAAERRPQHFVGEQVDSGDAVDWLAGVRASMELLGYAVGAADLPAACAGAPHIRQRLWWVGRLLADDDGHRRQARHDGSEGPPAPDAGGVRDPGRLADAHGRDAGAEGLQRGGQHRLLEEGDEPDDIGVADAGGWQLGEERLGRGGGEGQVRDTGSGRLGASDGVGDPEGERRGQELPLETGGAAGGGAPQREQRPGNERGPGRLDDSAEPGSQGRGIDPGEHPGQRDPWTPSLLVPCADERFRRTPPPESGVLPMDDGPPFDLGSVRAGEESPYRPGRQAPWRIGMIRGYGNAIVPQVAAMLLATVMEEAP